MPYTLLATKGSMGETSEGYRQSLGYRICLADPSYLYPIVEVGAPGEVFGTKTTRGMGLANARKMVSSIEPFFYEGLSRDCCFEVRWGSNDLGQCLTLGSL